MTRHRRAATSMITLLIFLALVITGCGTGARTAKDGTQIWDFTVTTGSGSTWYAAAELFATRVAEETDGRIQVRLFTNEQLSGGDPALGVEQLMSGEKALSFNSTIIYAGIDPRYGAINAPFLYDDLEQARATLDARGIAGYTGLAASDGVHVLGMGESGFRQVTNSLRPIRTPQDLHGVKLRIPGIGLFNDIYGVLGANPSSMNFAEVFSALQQGTIDGQENPIDVIYSSGLAEVQPHLTVWNYVYDPLILGMNKALYDSLSPSDREIVDAAAAEAVQFQIDSNRQREADQLTELRTAVAVVELTDQEIEIFRASVAPLQAEYAEIWGPDMVAAVTPVS